MVKRLIIKHILNKIDIHPFFLFIAISSAMTGMFHEFMIVLSILLIHELGHIVAACFYRWNIYKIHILPFGGNIEFRQLIHSSIKEELIIMFSGSFFQIIYFMIVFILFEYNIVPENFYSTVKSFHYPLLLFNLLPIYPLDGSKLMRCLFSSLLPFKRALQYTIYLSFISFMVAIFLINQLDYSVSYYLVLVFILYKTIIEWKTNTRTFYKFILERILYSFSFHKRKIIRGKHLAKMRKEYSHLFQVNSQYITERQVLNEWLHHKKVDK